MRSPSTKTQKQPQASGASGLRERRRAETRKAIADAALDLFLRNGYEQTTLDEIATAAGISRRTFFLYFESKEEILQAAQSTGFVEALRDAFDGVDDSKSPFVAVRKALPRLVARFETKESIAVDRLVQASATLSARKQGIYVVMEQNLLDALRGIWPDKADEERVKVVAMLAIGVLRLALDAWRAQHGKRPIAAYVRDGFAALESSL